MILSRKHDTSNSTWYRGYTVKVLIDPSYSGYLCFTYDPVKARIWELNNSYNLQRREPDER